jgi:DNA-binding IclR family transcriptional regulator
MRHQPDGASPVQSVDRALQVLEVLARRGTAGVSDIAGELGVHKSTASRLLSTLEGRGFVEQLSERGTYRLGFALLRLAGAGAAQLDVAVRGRAVCERLSAELDEAVGLAVLDGAAAVNVSQVHGSASVGVRNWVGRRTPLHATSSGKVLLALGPAEVVRELVDRPLARFTAATITDPTALAAELAEVRARGWAAAHGELESGLNAVAAPVRADGDRLVAALSVSAPAYRLPPERFAEVAQRVRAAAAEIRTRLGSP